MSLEKYDISWQRMRQYNFQVDPDSDNDRLYCLICKHLMIDTYQAPCGCLFCHDCIERYLQDGSKFCPGQKLECKDDWLQMNVNLFRHLRTINKIFKLKVLCPNESCNSKIELKDMDAHLRECNKITIKCPFTGHGCRNARFSKDTIQTHLYNESLSHSQILIELIENFQNEIKNLNEKFEKSQTEVLTQLEKGRINENKIETLEYEFMNMKNKVQMLERQAGQNEEIIASLERELLDVKAKLTENDEMLLGKSRGTNQNGAPHQYANEKLRMLVYDVRERVDEIKKDRTMLDNRDRIIRYWIKWNQLCPDVDADYIWKIDNLSLKKDTFVCSEHFYSGGFKFFLHYCLYGNDELKLGCYMTKGDNDMVIQWPMMKPITISILDQDTMLAFSSATYRYDTYQNKKAFNRPTGGSSEYIGGGGVISYSSIKGKASVIHKDTLIVSFFLGE